jgi:formate dehydrogenase beta subunit
MTRIAYGVWDGQIVDQRLTQTPLPLALSGLDGFDYFNKGNPIRAFIGDRGFLVFDDSVSLVDCQGMYRRCRRRQFLTRSGTYCCLC